LQSHVYPDCMPLLRYNKAARLVSNAQGSQEG